MCPTKFWLRKGSFSHTSLATLISSPGSEAAATEKQEEEEEASPSKASLEAEEEEEGDSEALEDDADAAGQGRRGERGPGIFFLKYFSPYFLFFLVWCSSSSQPKFCIFILLSIFRGSKSGAIFRFFHCFCSFLASFVSPMQKSGCFH